MQQINLKNYRQRFALSGKPITTVGINFDSTQGNNIIRMSDGTTRKVVVE